MATKRGRKPPSMSDERIKALLQALQGGNYIETACAYAGIAVSTVYYWLDRGRTEKARRDSGETPDKTKDVYLELLEAVEKARAQAVVANVTIVQQAARSGTWQAAAWWLERSMPQQYGRRLQAEVTTSVTIEDLERRMLEFISDDSSDIPQIEARGKKGVSGDPQ